MSINRTTTKTVYVNTDSLTQADASEDQINKFKIDLSGDPITVSDDERVSLNISQFQMDKNFMDLTQDNNGFRIFISGMADFTNTDEIFILSSNEVATQGQLAKFFAERLITTLQSKFTGAGTISLTTQAQPDRSFVCGDTSNDGRRLPVDTTNIGTTRLDFTISVSGGGVLNGGTMVIQSLYLDATQRAAANASSMTVNNQASLFNDSYVLVGASRVETFEATPTTASLRLIRSASAIRVKGHYPMSNHLSTIPYVYVKLLASTGINTVNQIICKVPRVVDDQQQVQYRIDDNKITHLLSTDAIISDIVLTVRDHNDRILPFFPNSSVNAGGQAKNGNASCNLILNIEKTKTKGINHI